MKKVIGVVGAILLMSSNLNAATSERDLKEEVMVAYFCNDGWDAVDNYYDTGGNDGFIAAQLFRIYCS